MSDPCVVGDPEEPKILEALGQTSLFPVHATGYSASVKRAGVLRVVSGRTPFVFSRVAHPPGIVVTVCFTLARRATEGSLLPVPRWRVGLVSVGARFLLCTVVTLVASTARGDEATARYYEQLRQRQFFSLVEADCLRRFEGQSLGERDRGNVVLELSRTYAAHAWQTFGAEQDDLWRRARQVVTEFLEQFPRYARRELFDVQRALIDLGQAEWSLAQTELWPDDRELPQRGSSAVEAAIQRLTALDKSVGKDLRQGSAAGSPRTTGEADKRLTLFERRALSQQIRLRLGTARLVQAQLMATNAVDRAASLVAVDEWLLPLAAGPSGDRLTWESQLALAEVIRLRGDLDRAAKMLATLDKNLGTDAPKEVQERFVIERIRWWLAKRQPAEAATWMIEQRRGGLAMSSELSFWQVEIELDLWRLATVRGDAELAIELWTQAEAEVMRLEQGEEGGGYWAARAKRAWQLEREMKEYGRELATLVRRARAAFATETSDEARQLFDAAIAAAKQANQPELLLQLTDTRASLLFQAGKYDEAAVAFGELASAPRHERSAATHLLWAISLGKSSEQMSSDERWLEFVKVLQSLRERYPDEPEAAEAAWLLAQWAERQQHFRQALEWYSAVPMKHVRRDEAWAAVARCHERLIAKLRIEGISIIKAEEAALEQLIPAAKAVTSCGTSAGVTTGSSAPEASAANTDNKRPVASVDDDAELRSPPPLLKRAQAELLVRVARLLLERQPAEYRSADQLLAHVIANVREGEWRKSAEQLRVVSLAGQRRIDDAERLLDSLEEAGPDELLTLLDGLTSVAAHCDAGTQRLVAELQLRTSNGLAASPASLTAAQKLRLWRVRAEAFAATGQPSKALSIYQQLVEQSPRDIKLLRTAAELCDIIDSSAATTRAKSYWRRLESALKAGTPEWLDARWHLIRCCQKLGEQTEADKLLKVTKLLYPDLGGPVVKAKFNELESP